ncbi:FAD:protein FMN transferase [Alloscardovia criceti]|uniref:FAD:protein FMN transferase n=1 Tax=Alloscardovia criceti TaxID=356828 RepID=UPI0003815910|nr:FAD:protein FMN transferase [Alloscardovia criceti]
MSVLLDFPHAVGTGIIISSSRAEMSQQQIQALHSQLAAFIHDFEQYFSRFQADSLLSQMTQHREFSALFPPYAAQLFDIYDALYRATDGRFTPTVAEDLVRLGYGEDFGVEATSRATWGVDVWRDPQQPYLLHTSRPVHLDFGAAGKGFLVDLLAQALIEHGWSDFTINAGGDIFTTEGLRVGLENPQNFEQAVGMITLQPGQALCASSPSRRHWTPAQAAHEVHHIIDGLTGESTQDIAATWTCVDAQHAGAYPTAWADALSTALFFCAPQALLQPDIPQWSFARLGYTQFAQQSANWQGEFFTSNAA